MSSAFRTAVSRTVDRETRAAAIDRLAEEGDTANLRLLVQTGGIHAGLRRQALSRLADAGASAELQRVTADRTVDEQLRTEAQRRV